MAELTVDLSSIPNPIQSEEDKDQKVLNKLAEQLNNAIRKDKMVTEIDIDANEEPSQRVRDKLICSYENKGWRLKFTEWCILCEDPLDRCKCSSRFIERLSIDNMGRSYTTIFLYNPDKIDNKYENL